MNIEDDILIENYFTGLLSKEEKYALTIRLGSDEVFRKQFSLEKQLYDCLNNGTWSFIDKKSNKIKEYKEVLEEDEIKKLKQTLKQVNLDYNQNSKPKVKRLFYYLAAACVTFLLCFQLLFDQKLNNQELYSEFIGLDDLPSFVSRSDDHGKLVKAQELFESGKFEEALLVFQTQLESIGNKGDLLIYIGLSQIELKNYIEAEQTFDEFINSDLLDSEKGYWYKALLFLKQNRVEETKVVLEKIIAENLFNKLKAEELLEELD